MAMRRGSSASAASKARGVRRQSASGSPPLSPAFAPRRASSTSRMSSRVPDGDGMQSFVFPLPQRQDSPPQQRRSSRRFSTGVGSSRTSPVRWADRRNSAASVTMEVSDPALRVSFEDPARPKPPGEAARRRSSAGGATAAPDDPLASAARRLLDIASGAPLPSAQDWPKGAKVRHAERGEGEVVSVAEDADGRLRVHVRFGGSETHRYAQKSLHKLQLVGEARRGVAEETCRRLQLLQAALARARAATPEHDGWIPLPELQWCLPDGVAASELDAVLPLDTRRLWAGVAPLSADGVAATLRPARVHGRALSGRRLAGWLQDLAGGLYGAAPLSLPRQRLVAAEAEDARAAALTAYEAAAALSADEAEAAAWAAAQRVCGSDSGVWVQVQRELAQELRERVREAAAGAPSVTAAAEEARGQAEAALGRGDWEVACEAVRRGVRSGMPLEWLPDQCAAACERQTQRAEAAADTQRQLAEDAWAQAQAARAEALAAAEEAGRCRRRAAAAEVDAGAERRRREDAESCFAESREALVQELRDRERALDRAQVESQESRQALSMARVNAATELRELREAADAMRAELAAAQVRQQEAAAEAVRMRRELRSARSSLGDSQQKVAALAARAAGAESTVALWREQQLVAVASPLSSPMRAASPPAGEAAVAQAEHVRAECLLQRIDGMRPVPCSPRRDPAPPPEVPETEISALQAARLRRALLEEQAARRAAEQRAAALAEGAERRHAEQAALAAQTEAELRRRCSALAARPTAVSHSAATASVGVSTDALIELSPVASPTAPPQPLPLPPPPLPPREPRAAQAAVADQARQVAEVLRAQLADVEQAHAGTAAELDGVRRRLCDTLAANAVLQAEEEEARGRAADEQQLRCAAEGRVAALEAAAAEGEERWRRQQAEAAQRARAVTAAAERGAAALQSAAAERDELRALVAAEAAAWRQKLDAAAADLVLWQQAHSDASGAVEEWRAVADGLQSAREQDAAEHRRDAERAEERLAAQKQAAAAERQRCSELEERVAELGAAGEAAVADLQAARDGVQKEAEEAARLRRELGAAAVRAEQLEQEAGRQAAAAAASDASAAEAAAAATQSASEASRSAAEAADLRGRLDAAERARHQEAGTAAAQLREAETRRAAAESRHTSDTKRAEQTHRHALAFAQQQQRRLEAELEAAEGRCAEVTQQLAGERQRRAAADAAVASLSPTKGRAEQVEAAHREQSRLLREASAEAEAVRAQLKKVREQAVADAAERDGVQQMLRQTADELRDRCRSLQLERDGAAQQAQKAAATLAAERQRSKRAREQTALTESGSAEAARQVGELTGVRRRLEDRVAEREAEVAALRAEVDAAKSRERAARAEADSAKRQLAEAESNVRRSRAAQDSAARVRGAGRDGEVGRLTAQVASLRDKLQAEQERAAGARRLASQLELALARQSAADSSPSSRGGLQQAVELCQRVTAALSAGASATPPPAQSRDAPRPLHADKGKPGFRRPVAAANADHGTSDKRRPPPLRLS
eukprot:TRINITY_DN8544_c0_g1_i1.p1 TRINITY_DN8544_c0_g1~~TRINITY_DN8544_c0_g1_i1.p1  ORF type:complete len:1524 (+),score=733.11 TRINITY_DN8544_c0_g1_i1:553-5124(+)